MYAAAARARMVTEPRRVVINLAEEDVEALAWIKTTVAEVAEREPVLSPIARRAMMVLDQVVGGSRLPLPRR